MPVLKTEDEDEQFERFHQEATKMFYQRRLGQWSKPTQQSEAE